MKKIKLVVFLLIFAFSCKISASEFVHPAIHSFEENISPAVPGVHSQLSVSNEHFKHQTKSLKWMWNAPRAEWSIKQPIPYHKKMSSDNEVSSFVFWIYSKKALVGKSIKVEFLKHGKICSWFDYGLDFTGWRGSWVSFDRDMQGTPEVDMDEMRIIAPDVDSGELFFDNVILAINEDSRYHTADFQAPYINSETTSHWLILLKNWNEKLDFPREEKVSATQRNSIKLIENRLRNFLLDGKKPTLLSQLKERYTQYHLEKNTDGTIKGLPVFFERYGETYDALGAPNYQTQFAGPSSLSKTSDLLLQLAVTYSESTDESVKKSVGNMYISLMRHLIDQGFQAGSGMGTLHHLGYGIRDYYPAAFLMKDLFRKEGLADTIQQACEWFAGTGEVKIAPVEPGMDVDAFNTSLMGRLVSILLLKDNPYKAAYLSSFKRWIDNGFLYTEGTKDGFKSDGSIYHHRHNYPAYAVGGLQGAVTANYLLYGTDFQLNPIGRNHLKKAFLAMRFYCNLQTWPLSLSGRHPTGKGSLVPRQYAILALTGTPDYSEKIDKELAAAYLRLETQPKTKYKRLFENLKIQSELSPEGNENFNYSCLNVQRRRNWMVTAMGFSRYLWNTEIYPGANMYGRYMNYGNLQITATGDPISDYGSGFNQDGWDWNHFPGTTTTVLAINELRANVINPDVNSGNEEMLLSDEAFAGGVSFQGQQGIFAMKLHENPKYGGNLKARKSFFFFDNRVVCLGSGISGGIKEKPVQTTLFQVFLPDSLMPIEVDNEKITDFPYYKTLNKNLTSLSDGLNNYFFINDGKVNIKRSLQHSFDQETEKPTQNKFALAAIDNGIYPSNSSYDYMILVQPDKKELEQIKSQMASSSQPYQVIRQDTIAHIVRDNATGITGYVFFEALKLSNKTDIICVSKPCMMMESIEGNLLKISVNDPDLHLYDGKKGFEFDSSGKYIERSVYSLPWINNPIKNSEIDIEIKGMWKLHPEQNFVKVIDLNKDYTKIKVVCNANNNDTNFYLEKL